MIKEVGGDCNLLISVHFLRTKICGFVGLHAIFAG